MRQSYLATAARQDALVEMTRTDPTDRYPGVDAERYRPAMTEPEHPQPEAAPRARRRWLLVGAVAAVVVLAAGGAAYALTPGTEDEAVERCHDAIRDKLFSPSTAVFAEDVEQNNTPPVYRVLGELDAQNKFGGTLRGEYICVLRHEDDGSWTTIDARTITR